MTQAMNSQMRRSFASIRPSLASRSTPRVLLARPPPIHHRHRLPPLHHHHHHPRRMIRSVLPLSSRTWCLTSLPFSRPFGMRPWSTASSSARMWRPSGPTCAQFWPTRPPSFVLSRPFRTSLPSFSLSTSRHRSDPTDHQRIFLHPLSFFLCHWGQCPLVWGVWVIGFWSSWVVLVYLFCFGEILVSSALVSSRL